MLNKRQEELLKVIVEEYIKTVHPISSSSLCEKFNCSSATIRNEMVFLEENKLIEKTHISSGRIPSEKGYRYYVDNIMKPKDLEEKDMLKLQTIFSNKSLMLDDVILRSLEIISELTSYTSLVLGKSSCDNKVSKIEAVPIDECKLVVLIITDKGHVEHKHVVMESKVSLNDIKQTIDLINKLIVGTPINDVSTILEYEIKPIIGQYVKQHEILYNAFYNAFSDFKTGFNVKVSGTSNILKQPEFDDVKRVREIISKFEDKNIVNKIKEEDNGINIYIGSENNFDEDVTVVKAKYYSNGQEGTIAIIGPKRMEYDRVTTLLNFITENINDK
ncbi:MAG TPA: heat-inducible transcription repressor HrcA [Tenericutes bacterium]|nr:heat-inducible transcription repressor HrcA [Mycoplasmatota bacterium]